VRLTRFVALGNVSVTDRINYLFQNGAADIGIHRTVDAHDVTVSLRLSPR
jgi:hypothetical protein